MTPRELIDTATVPGGEDLRLFRRGRDFMIVLDRNELMSTRMNGSEIALGTMACDRLAGRNAPHLLIGGYGMGFTLRAVLERLDAAGRVPHWPSPRDEVTLHQILVHMIAETHRHAGHADIVRELVDGTAGLRADNDNLAPGGPRWWAEYRDRLEKAAREA